MPSQSCCWLAGDGGAGPAYSLPLVVPAACQVTGLMMRFPRPHLPYQEEVWDNGAVSTGWSLHSANRGFRVRVDDSYIGSDTAVRWIPCVVWGLRPSMVLYGKNA